VPAVAAGSFLERAKPLYQHAGKSFIGKNAGNLFRNT
jgi:hypothetical protein